ncbi:MAG: SurA N-terminal domain-containing protein [Bacteroidaceae bacterium]
MGHSPVGSNRSRSFCFYCRRLLPRFDTLFGEDKRHVGQVYNEKLAINDYQSLIDEYTEAIKFTRGESSLSDAEQNQFKDQVWQTFVNNELIKHEAEKLGLTVTDAELNNVISTGTNPMLMQTPFVNKQTGRFDAAQLKQFLEQYDQMLAKPDQVPQEYIEYYQRLYKFWGFIEKTLLFSVEREVPGTRWSLHSFQSDFCETCFRRCFKQEQRCCSFHPIYFCS